MTVAFENVLYLSGATGATTKRTPAQRAADITNILDFGADPTGVADSTSAINAAIAAAAAQSPAPFGPHGGTVLFSPGKYLVSGALINNTMGTDVCLIGAARNAVFIVGTFAGFIIDQRDGTEGAGAQTGTFSIIDNMTIQNGYKPASSGYNTNIGAIRYNGGVAGSVIRNCDINGWNGIAAYSNQFSHQFESLNIVGHGAIPGVVGIAGGSQNIINCNVNACWVGVSLTGTGQANLTNHHCEDTYIVLAIGQNADGTTGFASPTSVDCLISEACNNTIYIVNGNVVTLNAVRATGTIGAPFPITNLSWSGGTVTATVSSLASLDSYGWTSGTKTITISAPNAWTLNNAWVTATRVNSTTFTYAAANPGVAFSSASWSFKQTGGFYLRGASNLVANGCFCAIAGSNIATGGAGFDLNTGGDTNPNNVLNSCSAGTAGWAMPTGHSKAGWLYNGCDQPAGSTTDAFGNVAGMSFADLPGQTSVILTPAVEGMTFDIVDCNTATFLATAAGGGSGATAHRRVRYNAAVPAWQVMG